MGPPVSTPKGVLSRSPSGRQRHYGAVELAGAGDQVNVNDVVEVGENHKEEETSERHPVLVQVRLGHYVSGLGDSETNATTTSSHQWNNLTVTP